MKKLRKTVLKFALLGLTTSVFLIQGARPTDILAHTSGTIFRGTGISIPYIRTADSETFPFGIITMTCAAKSSANDTPRTFDNAFTVVPVGSTSPNQKFFEYKCNMAYGQSSGALAQAAVETTDLSVDAANPTTFKTGKTGGDDGGYFSNLYASAHSTLRLFSYLRIVSQELKFKPPGESTYRVDVATMTAAPGDFLAGKGVLVGTNSTEAASLPYSTNLIPWTQSADDTRPYIACNVFYPNVGIFRGAEQRTSYGINFSGMTAPNNIKIDLYRVTDANWKNMAVENKLFQRVSTLIIPKENIVGNFFVRYKFPASAVLWDVIQADDKSFPLANNYDCQYAISVTLEYQKPDGSFETESKAFQLRSGLSPANILKLFYVNRSSSEVFDETARNEYLTKSVVE